MRGTLEGTCTNEYNKTKAKYNLLGENDDSEDEEEDDDNNYEPNIANGEGFTHEKPYLITELSYSEDFMTQGKLQFTFFMEDGVLVDEMDEIIDDPNRIVGLYNLDTRYMDVDHIIYIRNEKTGNDYAVEMNPNSYQEIIQGGSPSVG